MVKTIESAPGVGQQQLDDDDNEDPLDTLHKAQVVLKLAAYAADAMRVLNVLQQHADRFPSLDQRLKAICADWRNPGSLNDPADLITEALVQVSQSVEQLLRAGGRR